MSDGLFNLKDKDVKELCSKQVFERGLTYFREGRVLKAQIYGTTLRGEVEGSEPRPYRVKIEYEEKNDSSRFIPKCSCPFDLEEFCKHSIALLLQWVHEREEFTNTDEVLKELSDKSKEELLTLIEGWISTNPDILERVSKPDSKTFKRRLRALFSSDQVDYYHVRELIEELEEIKDDAEKLYKRKNAQESFNLVKEIIDACTKNYELVDDSDGMMASFIEECTELCAKIILDLNVEWAVRQKIHEDNWKMFVIDEYGYSDCVSRMIVDSCATEDDFAFIEKLALEELEKRESRTGKRRWIDEHHISEIVDILIDIYEKKGDDEAFLRLCEKEFRYSYLRYIEKLESKGKIDEAVQCCIKALDFAEGFNKTDLVEKLGDLMYIQGNMGQSLAMYMKAFKDRPADELLEKVRRLSEKLGRWKEVKDELTASLSRRGDAHELVKMYLKDKDLDSAFKTASQNIDSSPYDAERVAKMCEKSVPDKAAELYRMLAEKGIKQSNRNGYRLAKHYFKIMKRLYSSLGRAEEFNQYVNAIKLANKKKPALQEELSQLRD